EREVPRLTREEICRRLAPGDESRDMMIDDRAGIAAQKLDKRPVIAVRARCLCVERRKLLQHLRFRFRREVAATHFVAVARTARVHQQRSFGCERVLEREMDLVGAAGNFTDGAY